MAQSLNAQLQIGNYGTCVPGQPIGLVLVLQNPTASNISITGTPTIAITSNGNPFAGCNTSPLTAVGNQVGGGAGGGTAAVVPAGGQLVYSGGFTIYGPQGSAETGSAQGNASTSNYLVSVNVITSDGNSFVISQTVGPSQYSASGYGGAGFSAGATGPGQFNFFNPANSGLWQSFL